MQTHTLSLPLSLSHTHFPLCVVNLVIENEKQTIIWFSKIFVYGNFWKMYRYLNSNKGGKLKSLFV